MKFASRMHVGLSITVCLFENPGEYDIMYEMGIILGEHTVLLKKITLKAFLQTDSLKTIFQVVCLFTEKICITLRL